MMTSAPMISVLMSVYNAEDDLHASIESILNQTYSNFEFIIVNDGSTDRTKEKLESYAKQDDRIKLIHQDNTGLTKALNNGIQIAKGQYIARQDADDISYPERLERQLALIRQDQQISLVGGNSLDQYPSGYQSTWGFSDSETLQKTAFLKTPFPHSTAFMRTETLKKLGGYNESYKTSQDMELWMRFAKHGKLVMTQEPILTRHIVEGSISKKRRWRQFYDASRARWQHNHGFNRIHALYYGVRSLIINLLPSSIIKVLKKGTRMTNGKIEVQAIVFDFDGVLVESVHIKGDAFVKLYANENNDVQEQVRAYHNAHGGVTRYDKIRYYENDLCGRTANEDRIEELANQFSDIVETLVIQSAWVKGAKGFLEEHYKDVPMYIASATPHDELLRITKKRNMDHYFKGIYGAPKKKGEHIRTIINQQGYDPDKVLMIGDAMTDYDAATETHTHFIGRKLPNRNSPFPENTVLINDLTELKQQIEFVR